MRISTGADVAQSVERKAFNLVVVGSSPTVGDSFFPKCCVFVSCFSGGSFPIGVYWLLAFFMS